MLYATNAPDVPNSVTVRPKVRPRPLQYLHPLLDQGRVVFGGVDIKPVFQVAP
jgi:hypothetical protein